jgi:predicted AlkP superfamily pyrophosphatase or phosphodiesterase
MSIARKCCLLLWTFAVLEYAVAQDTTQHVVGGRRNSPEQQRKPYLILISADGFRYDLVEKYHAEHLLAFRDQGVKADFLQACYPSLTFPNHYSIITGCYPAHNGLVDNNFFDPKRSSGYSMSNKKAVADSSWYGGTPLWVLAESNQMITASFYWVASESAIQGIRPTYYFLYNDKISMEDRIHTVTEWLELPPENRPHLITFYFPEVDHQEHLHGPDSKEAEAAVHFVDESVAKLVASVQKLGLPVSFVFLADHGMMQVDNEHSLPLPAAIDTTQFVVPPGGALLHLYAKDRKFIETTYKALKSQATDFDVYLAGEMPARWHYNTAEDRFGRIGDILLIAHPGKIFNINNRHVPLGEHGYDPFLPQMHASFYAWGPAFKAHMTIPGFENIHVYPMIADLLGLPVKEPIDGSLSVLSGILVNDR